MSAPRMLFVVFAALLSTPSEKHAIGTGSAKGWTVTSHPGRMVLRPDNLQAGKEVRAEVHHPEPAAGDLLVWMRERIGRSDLPRDVADRCRGDLQSARAGEAWCSASSGAYHISSAIAQR